MGMVLSDEQVRADERDGYLLVEDVVDPRRCADPHAAAQHIVAGFQPSAERTVFTTCEQERRDELVPIEAEMPLRHLDRSSAELVG